VKGVIDAHRAELAAFLDSLHLYVNAKSSKLSLQEQSLTNMVF
jgi:hypothetical protein